VDLPSAVRGGGQAAGKQNLLVFIQSADALDAGENLLKLACLGFRSVHKQIMP
jgi:hypothetical protein